MPFVLLLNSLATFAADGAPVHAAWTDAGLTCSNTDGARSSVARYADFGIFLQLNQHQPPNLLFRYVI
jgi:hypothetical protein